MEIDLKQFSRACNPGKTLISGNPPDWQHYYVDCSLVRGGRDLATILGRTIIHLLPNEPTCQLLTGYSGCGKSVELLRLQANLERYGFHVVYLKSRKYLDMAKVASGEILLAIACRVIENLETVQISLSSEYLVKLFNQIETILNIKLEIYNLPQRIDKLYERLTAYLKNNPNSHRIYNNYITTETNSILQIINEEVLDIANERLKEIGKEGLVVIVDDLDSLDIQNMRKWLPIFIDPDERLRKLKCHVIYAIPLALIMSKNSELVKIRLGGGVSPEILSIVPVQLRSGESFVTGIELLRQIVLVRAFPLSNQDERLGLVNKVFDSLETLDRLCSISGGHVPTLLELLSLCLREKDPPFSRDFLERVIKGYRSKFIMQIDDDDWRFIQQFAQEKVVRRDDYLTLFQSMERKLVFKYFDDDGHWFAIHPLLLETSKLQSSNLTIIRKKENKMKDFFISYNRANRTWAEWIAWTLEEEGYSIIIDSWDFRAGKNLALEMQKATSGTKQTIAILSENYLNANYTHPEWAAAFSRDPQGKERTLIPIRVEECELVGLLANIRYVDLVGCTDEREARHLLIEELSGRGKPAQAPIFPGFNSIPKSERVTHAPVAFPAIATFSGENKIWTEQERVKLMRKLNALPASQFSELIFSLEPPIGVVPNPPIEQTDRTFALLNWARQPIGCGLTKVEQILNQILNSSG
ncbi:hypothetical protein NIES4101_26600 (plasmid) [Calothrix sp. NIES-4101]|nr:hypothetical protein NIES4101_26600 [Calothrix sp. NIES-4101]